MKKNRSFARRVGKSLSQAKKDLLKYELGNFLAHFPINKDSTVVLEIGFGMGDNLIQLANTYKDKLIIGAEVYLNGVVRVLKHIKEHNIANIRIWPDDINLILDKFEEYSVEEIQILFPDPWHKKKHNKRRLIDEDMIRKLVPILRVDGRFIFASDNNEYFQQVKKHLSCFMKEMPLLDSFNTKYNNKASSLGRESYFMCFQKIKSCSGT